ncbi:MAG: hypothetical protein ACYC0V_09345 [Armatimonadota bacterium]
MKIRFSVLLLLLCMLMCANTLCAQEFVSANPRYAAVVLPEFGAKTVSIIFDESAGTGKGYDTVYLDANLDGTIGEDERFSADSDDPEMEKVVIHSFPNVDLKPAVKMQVSYQMSFFYSRFDADESFSIYVIRKMQYKGKPWDVGYSGSLKPSKIKEQPVIYRPVRAPKAVAKSAPNEKATGIAISLGSDGVDVSSSSITVDLVLKNKAGKVVKKDKGTLDKFGFG